MSQPDLFADISTNIPHTDTKKAALSDDLFPQHDDCPSLKSAVVMLRALSSKKAKQAIPIVQDLRDRQRKGIDITSEVEASLRELLLPKPKKRWKGGAL